MHGYVPGDNKRKAEKWTATGTQFQIPYVFKKLFSREDIAFEDMYETKSVEQLFIFDLNEGVTGCQQGRKKEFSKAESDYKKGLLSDTTLKPHARSLLH